MPDLRQEITDLARDSYSRGRKDALAAVIEAVTEAYGTVGTVAVDELLAALRSFVAIESEQP